MSRAAAEVGSTANSYQILAKLATGGMAEIFLARGEGVAGVERYCVLKRILRDRASDVHFVQMFLDEARLAAQLQHPNIAQVYDIGKLGDSYFFTMEYVHGETVRALMHRAQSLQRALPINSVLTIIAGAAAGLHHAHGRIGLDGRALGIVHRDVTPSNLMVSYEGGVKLVDFGVAKASDRAHETKSGTVKGKISYLSPEQCRGKRVDRRSDLFSLGICFWEMLTTDRLYRRDSDFENMNAIVGEPPPPPSSRRPEVPPELDELVLKLLAKEPEDRYQTADEVIEAVEAAAARTSSVLSASGLGRYVRELFGQRPEPWLELETHQELGEAVTVTSEPIPPELAIPPGDRVDRQLAGVVDLSPRQLTESLDIDDISSVKSAKPMAPAPKPPALPAAKPAMGEPTAPLKPSLLAQPREPTASLKPGAPPREPTASLKPGAQPREPTASLKPGAQAREPTASLEPAALVGEPTASLRAGSPSREPTASLGKRGFPLAAPPPTQPGIVPLADAASPETPARSTGPAPVVRSTGPSPTRGTGPLDATTPPIDTFTEPDPTALPAPPLPPPGAWSAADDLAEPEASSPALGGTSGLSGAPAEPPAAAAAVEPSSSGQPAPFAPQPTVPASPETAPRTGSRRMGWPLYAVIFGAALVGSIAVVLLMPSGPSAGNDAPVASGTAAVAAPLAAEHRAPIVEPIEAEPSAPPGAAANGSGAATTAAPTPEANPAGTATGAGSATTAGAGSTAPGAAAGAPPRAGSSATTRSGTKRGSRGSAADASHAGDKHAAPAEDIAQLYAAGHYERVVAQCGVGPIAAERAALCFLAACHVGDETAARRLIAVVPAARRDQLTTNCKQFGVDIKKADCEADPMACQR